MARTPYNDPEAEAIYVDNHVSTKVAGDVTPLPITPKDSAGPTMDSADYVVGKRTDPKVSPIPSSQLNDWLRRARERQR